MKKLLCSSSRLRLIHWVVSVMLLVALLLPFQSAEAYIASISTRLYTNNWKVVTRALASGQADAGNQIRVRMEIIPKPIYLKVAYCNRTVEFASVLITPADVGKLFTLLNYIPRDQCFEIIGKRANGWFWEWVDVRFRMSY